MEPPYDVKELIDARSILTKQRDLLEDDSRGVKFPSEIDSDMANSMLSDAAELIDKAIDEICKVIGMMVNIGDLKK